MKEESGGKKVDQFWESFERFICERDPCIWCTHLFSQTSITSRQPSLHWQAPVPVLMASDLSGFNDKPFNVNHLWTDSKYSDSRERALSSFREIYSWVSSAYCERLDSSPTRRLRSVAYAVLTCTCQLLHCALYMHNYFHNMAYAMPCYESNYALDNNVSEAYVFILHPKKTY